MPGWSAMSGPLPSTELVLNTDVSIHDQGRDPASLTSCGSPGTGLATMLPSLNSEFAEPEEGRDYSQCTVPIDSSETTPSESLILPGTDPWICRFIDDVTVMFNGAEDKVRAYVTKHMEHTKSSPGDESDSDSMAPTLDLDEGRESQQTPVPINSIKIPKHMWTPSTNILAEPIVDEPEIKAPHCQY